MTIAFYALLSSFAIIALGAALNWRKLVSADMWVGLERVSYFVLFPALIIRALGTADLAKAPVFDLSVILAGAMVVVMAALFAVRPLIYKYLKVGGAQFSSIFQGATRWNSFVALAIATAAFGEEGVVMASIAIAAMIPLANLACVTVVASHAGADTPGPLALVGVLARNPFIIACAIGILLNVSGLPIWTPIDFTLDILGKGATGTGLLVVGAGLRLDGLARAKGAIVLTSVLKLALMPALVWAGCEWLDVQGTARFVALVAAAVPSASSSFILARQLGGDTELIAGILTVQTVAAAATLPLVLWLAAF
ncbi:MAG: AEC family transporter [Alphaproteobacteria bacterium]